MTLTTFTLPPSVASVFPTGTLVSAYLYDSDSEGGPSGSAIDTQVMNGTVTFQNLPIGKDYWAIGTVAGQRKRLQFFVPVPDPEVVTLAGAGTEQANDTIAFDGDLERWVAKRGLKALNILDEASTWHADMTTDDLSSINAGIEKINSSLTPEKVLLIPGANYAVSGKVEPITRSGVRIVTPGREALGFTMLSGSTSGTLFEFDSGVVESAIGGYTVTFQNDLTAVPTQNPIRFGSAIECTQFPIRVLDGSGVVTFDTGSSRCELKGAMGRVNLALGGWTIKSSGINVRCRNVRMNAGTSDGAFAGGGFILLDPPDTGVMDTGLYADITLQGGNNLGPDFGIKFNLDKARSIVNQWFHRIIIDHVNQIAMDFYGPNGATGYINDINFTDGRISADGAALLLRILWGSSDRLQALNWKGGQWNHRGVLRACFVSAPHNTATPEISVSSVADNSEGGASPVAPGKTAFTFSCGNWRVRRPSIRRAVGAIPGQASAYARGGELLPYEMWVLTVDAAGGTFTVTGNGSTTSALAYNISAAALQTALEGLYGAGNVAVEGGIGGTYGPTAKGRLAILYTTGTTTMVLSNVTGVFPSSGSVNMAGTGVSVNYTGVTGSGADITLTGCSGGTGSFLAGQTAVVVPNTASGAPYFIQFKGTYAPTATQAPGYGSNVSTAYTTGTTLTLDDNGMFNSGGGTAYADNGSGGFDSLTYTGKTGNKNLTLSASAPRSYAVGTRVIADKAIVPVPTVNGSSLTPATGGGIGAGRGKARVFIASHACPTNNLVPQGDWDVKSDLTDNTVAEFKQFSTAAAQRVRSQSGIGDTAPLFLSDLATNRPAAGQLGRIFYATDTPALYFDNGSAWKAVTLT